MKIVVSGSRTITDHKIISKAMTTGIFELGRILGRKDVFKNDQSIEIISGHARGVDKMAELWAKQHGFSVKLFIPDWDGQGKKAGMLRNEEMANYGDAVLAIWDGESRGTKHMIDYAQKIKKPLFYARMRDVHTYTLVTPKDYV